MSHLSFCFTILVSIFPLVKGHGCLTKIVANGQTACAGNARDAVGCTPTDGLKIRTLIARSGNDGECANPPGCEASFSCDWCGLEKVRTFNQIVPGKWWTGMPAAHWDNPAVDPVFACMSKDAFGARGKMNVKPGDSVTTNFYINADHSGLYRFELMCGNAAENNKFAPITPWLALHKDKDGATLGEDRVVGYTKAETDAYFQQTTCSGGGCGYRMNRGVAGPDSGHCKGNIADCYAFDTFTIPSDTQCSGDAILRWHWNSAEGPEVYTNCLDLNVDRDPNSPVAAPTTAPPTVARAPSSEVVKTFGCASGRLKLGDDCRDNPECCPSGYGCYKKDEFWGSCRDECEAGKINPDDPVEYQKPWDCQLLGSSYPDAIPETAGHGDGTIPDPYNPASAPANAPLSPDNGSKKNSIIFGISSWICFMLLLA